MAVDAGVLSKGANFQREGGGNHSYPHQQQMLQWRQDENGLYIHLTS